MQKKATAGKNQDQMLYAELGAGGGRMGPKSEPVESKYAQVKVDDMGYPACGPALDMSQPQQYSTTGFGIWKTTAYENRTPRYEIQRL